MKQQQFGHFIGGLYVQGQGSRPVHNPLAIEDLNRRIAFIETLGSPDDELIEAALEGAHLTHQQILRGFFPLSERLQFLSRLRGRLFDQKENMAQLICREVAKPIDLARREVDRALATLDHCIESGAELLGEQIFKSKLFDGFESLTASFERRPKGPLLAIAPFNFPLNLVIHKIAPAIVSGNPVILKPSEKASVCALTLVDFCKAEGLPAGVLSCINCAPAVTQKVIQDSRIAQVSFTGSSEVGWALHKLRSASWTLELGGNGLVYVDETADLDRAVQGILSSGFAYAGQVCIATQNVLIHESVFAKVVGKLKDKFESLVVCGDPQSPGVLCGPVIDQAALQRILNSIKLLSQMKQVDSITHPTRFEALNFVAPRIFVNQNPALFDSKVFTEEAFAPWITVSPLRTVDDFIDLGNRQPNRLQAALYTQNAILARDAASKLDFGGVVINDSPSLRLDGMPYGGQGLSGLGREGPRFAIEGMTTTRSVLIRS
jgi:acyl-CoA reductase-like NAD-dependent aldehyde dehydrogenase